MIRRQLRDVAPLLAHYYGIRPDTYHRYTVDELNAFVAALPRQEVIGGVEHT